MAQKKNNSNNSEEYKNAYFFSLELENIRCFSKKQKIDFSDGKGNCKKWTIILGDNGTGKTTILQALASVFNLYYVPDSLKRYPAGIIWGNDVNFFSK